MKVGVGERDLSMYCNLVYVLNGTMDAVFNFLSMV